MNFNQKIVIITGASSGIGHASAIQFAKNGAKLILVSRNMEKLNKISEDLKKFNVSPFIIECDVSDKTQVNKISKIILDRFGTVDILVNNAGFAIYGSVNKLTVEEIESQMATNYFGMVYFIKNFLPSMIKKKSGHIVNVASVAASFGLPGIAPYCASKFAILGFSEGLKHELKGTGVGITIVSPIMVRTNFFNHPSFKNMPKYSVTSLSPETVAKAVLRASNSPRLEIIVPEFVRCAVWIKNTFPYLVNPILNSSFGKQLQKFE